MFISYLNKLKNSYISVKNNLSTQKTKELIRSNKRYFTSGFVAIFTICFFTFNLGSLLKNVWTSLANLISNVDGEVKEIVMKSDGYDESAAGSIKVTKRADWTSSSTAQMLYEVDTKVETNDVSKDIVLVLDTSVSMKGARIVKLKTEVSELIDTVLLNGNNRVSIITFSTNSEVLTDFTNNEEILKDAVNSIEAIGDTNYYRALLNVEDVLADYQKENNRELIILFVTDGYPNIDSPNHNAQYKIIKSKHPYAKVYGVNYEGGKNIVEALSNISDKQYSASNYNNTLLEVALSPEYYETFEVVEYVDNDYFYVDSLDDIKVSMGSVQITKEDGSQKIVWTAAEEEFRTGQRATMEINLKLQSNRIGIEGLYPTSTDEEVSFNLHGEDVQNIISEDKIILKNGYKVKYVANAPEGCSASIDLEEVRYAYDIVELSNERLSCSGYDFKGWEVVEELSRIEKINDETFKMPTYDVIVRGKWTKTELDKTMDGTVYEKLTLYKAIANQAVMDNIKSEYVTNSTGIQFNLNSSNTNGKGVYTLSSTANDEYPVHYFRGDVNNNNVLFANYCWKIVRTTSTGGVKLIYNGESTTDGQCINQTGTSTQLTTKAFNTISASRVGVGYMYDSTVAANYVYKNKILTSTNAVLTEKTGMASTSYYYSKNVTYDGTKYVLGADATKYSWNNSFSTLGSGYYTCLSATATSCSTVNYVVGSTSSYAYYIPLSSGKMLEDVDNMKMSTTITDNGDGTYTLSNPVTIKKSEWYANYSSNKKYYTCPDHTSTKCSDMRYIASTTNYQYTYLNATNKYLYGNSFTWDGTNYTLKDTKLFWNFAIEDNELNNRHYTCLDTDGVCSTLSYVYYTDLDRVYYVQLKSGKSVENVLEETLNIDLTPNSTDAPIKDYIDNTWYANNMTGYTKYLENTIWCNDRSVFSIGGFEPNGGSLLTYLYLGPRGRSWTTRIPTLACEPGDSFTLSKAAGGVEGHGNNALDYPVGLITSDEVVLAGGNDKGVNSSYYLYTNQYYWTLSPYAFGKYGARVISVAENGRLNNSDASETNGVRPVVSLKADTEYIYGNGTAARPYVILTDENNSTSG